MSYSWTAAQSAAIETFGRDILVSAAAGSGKTAALTERIIRALTREDSPTDITRILAVTFTRASAAELRRRISKALSDRLAENPGDRRLIRQLMLLGSAKICTIDAFCSDIVKSNFQHLSLPAGFRVPDDTELKLLKKSVMEEVIDRAYDSADQGFAVLADSLSSNKDDSALWETLVKIYDQLQNLPEGTEYLHRSADELMSDADADFFASRAGRRCAAAIREQLEYYIRALGAATDELSADDATLTKYCPAFCADLDFCRALLSPVKAGDYAAAREVAHTYTPARLGSLRGDAKTERTEQLKTLRTAIKDSLKKLPSEHFALDPDALSQTIRQTSDMCRALSGIISQFEDKLQQEKSNRCICDFDDIRRHAYDLLVDADGKPTELAHEYAERFDEIFIDEYQDVTEVQDLIFRAVSNGHNRFMVGDIKQSIYGFRGADPSLFANYRAAFPPNDTAPEDDSGVTIFMSENFRCDQNVIKFVNLVCSRMFRACGKSVGYVASDDLVFAKPCADDYAAPQVNVAIIVADEKSDEPTDGGEDTEQATEISYIAAEISRLLRDDHRADGKTIRPGDIAVLCRAKSTCATVTAQLRRLGIPVNSDSAAGYYTRPEVSLMISLLTIIDNPQKDIPLAAVLRSPLFGFTMDEMSQIRAGAPRSVSLYDAVTQYDALDGEAAKKCENFIQKLDGYRDMARALPADRLVRGIYRDTAILSLAADDAARADLQRLYEYARQFEAGSFRGLYNFIKYINQAISEGDDGETPPAEPGADAVTVITVHHSKGLEFPVCFVCGCGKAFNFKDAQKELILNRSLPPGIRIKDSTGLAKLNTPIRFASALQSIREQTEEEMRLLYVAMTRARERLYITAQCLRGFERRLSDAELEREFPDAYPILHATSYLDWILPAVSLTPPPDASYTVDIISRSGVPEPLSYNADATPRRESESTAGDIAAFAEQLQERFSFVYPYEHLTRLPAKLSVSKLYPGMLDDEDDALPPDDFAEESPRLSSMTFTPAFLSGTSRKRITSTERGTATHVFLQFCDFVNCTSNGVEAELERLISRGFIPSRMAELVDINQASDFFRSEFYATLKCASDIRREQRFNIMLPASSFSEQSETAASLEGEQLLVQGVIDLFFTDAEGRLVLCDYKTDRLTPAELAAPSLAQAKLAKRHRTQLSYYAAALERICGKRPDKVVIYSLPLGQALDIDVDII
ncbi:MAG: UvrD-helicase domain-containing protein [Clostridia bacterium]|nr:UvrD-helicase domain-containing protein [Clostridia bacterium]